VLAGEGRVFCAGADVEWMRAAVGLSVEDNERDAAAMQAMFAAIDACPVPVIARVQGAALGGGMGLCAVSDIVVATANATFGFTEPKLGIIPAVISTFVVPKIGESHARALFATGERFDAERARHIGLVHEVVADDAALDARVAAVLDELRSAGPTAIRTAKALVRDIRTLGPEGASRHTPRHIAQQRTSEEGQEGLAAFLEKRDPRWKA
jgi:methylglutaconyl-CoA hydratase